MQSYNPQLSVIYVMVQNDAGGTRSNVTGTTGKLDFESEVTKKLERLADISINRCMYM